jgi:Protein of unknown function (DUF3800)
VFVFGDEAGDFKFRRVQGATRWFALCTVHLATCEVGHAMLDLRRSLKRRQILVGDMFHASSDNNSVRGEVFDLLRTFVFDIHCTLLDKPKAYPSTKTDEATFYKYAWYYHGKYLAKNVFHKMPEVYMSAAALETKKGKAAFRAAFNEVFEQVAPHPNFTLDFPFAISDPCLQVADYCAWAIGRKWEQGKTDFFEHIKDKVRSAFDLWKFGNMLHY